ncbi:MAG: glycerophosphodiester phosphodiesterase family protein [Myxococcales bacterium]|nr:glycerophosphodiester phosphodiesterase family protein [Myxococcales bacterium]
MPARSFAITLCQLIVVTCAACGADPKSSTAMDDATARLSGDGSSDSGQTADAGTAPIGGIDRLTGPAAKLFDCTTKGIPKQRLATTPLTCVLDPKCNLPMVVGHRGAGGDFGKIAPENSLAAIRAALWMGQDGVELDVRHTKDDHLVVIHDSTIDRTALKKGKVSDMTLSELQAIGLKPTNASAQKYSGDFSCERIPSLKDALALTKDRLFVDLDTKTSRTDLVVKAIEAAGVIDQVFVSVSDATQAAEARKLNPKIRVQIRPKSPSQLADALKLFVNRPPEVVEVPAPKVAELAAQAHAVGAKVFTNGWNVDAQEMVIGPQDAAYLKVWASGCDILQSEFPGAALNALGRAKP